MTQVSENPNPEALLSEQLEQQKIHDWKLVLPGMALVELYSVLVAMEEPSKQVYGELKAIDPSLRQFYLFKKPKESAISLCEDGTLPLVGPIRCLTSPDFSFVLCLKEKDTDREICSGCYSIGRNPYDGLFNKPLRLVCRGEGRSYAVLHTTVISKAAQATVKVALVMKKDIIGGHLPAIHGKLVARHQVEEYKDEFYRKYFQTALFSVPKGEAKELPEAGDREDELGRWKLFEIPLSRYVVAVPADGSLVIQPDVGINFPKTSLEPLKVDGVWSVAAEPYAEEPSIERFYVDDNYSYFEVSVTWVKNVNYTTFDGLP